MNLFNLGYSDQLPGYLKNRVVPTNLVAILLIALIATPFVVISFLYFPHITALIPFMGGLSCTIVLIANYFGGIRYSRIIMAILPILLAASYNAILCGEGDEPIMSVYLTELSFALIPFVIFDIKEKLFLSLTSSISALTIFTFPYTKLWITLEADTAILRNGWLGNVTVCLGVLTAFGCVLGLVAIGKKAEKESEMMRQTAEEEKKKLEIEKEENLKKTEELKQKQADEKKRIWANEGITLISKVIREGQEHDKLYDKIIATVVKYMRANQGGLFLVERESNKVEINLKACYAYGKKKYAEKSVLPGQGILGQAYLERQYVYLTEIPKNHVNITSGLGEAPPTVLLVVPLIVNEVVQGLLEIAAFQKIEAYEINFLEKLGEVIAMHINNQRVVEQTQRLLKESQEQSEMMRAQEEEMRQNMEELAATQENIERSQRKVQAIFNSAMDGIVMFTAENEVEMFNPAAEAIFGYRAEEIVGRSFEKLFMPQHDHQEDDVLTTFLSVGQQQIVKARRKDGEMFQAELRIQENLVGNQKVFIAIVRELS